MEFPDKELFRKQGEGYVDRGNPFLSRDDIINRQEFPYFSIISVTHLTYPQEEPPSIGGDKFSANDLDGIFDLIEKEIEKCCSEEEMMAKIFFSVSTGELVVVTRTKRIEKSYEVSLRIRGVSEDLYTTFTVTAIDDICAGSGYKFSTQNCEDAEAEFSLRFSVSNPAIITELEEAFEAMFEKGGKRFSFQPFGLYGRYDVSVILSAGQFQKLFPILHAYKIKLSPPEIGFNDDRVVEWFNQRLSGNSDKNDIFTINVRPLLYCGEVDRYCKNNDKFVEGKNIYAENILVQDRYLKNEIEKLQRRQHEFIFCSSEFEGCMDLLRDIRKTYSGVRYENDSLVNGYMFFSQMVTLIQSLNEYIDYISGGGWTSEEDFRGLIRWLKTVIVCINSFSKLVQSINLQSIQSPNFEMQTRMDMEKYAIAYSEFLRKFSAGFYLNAKEHNKQYQRRLLPIFAIDLNTESESIKINSVLPFPTMSEESTRFTLLSISAPSVDYFTALYDTLPLVCHEISHNFRFQKRDERNAALSEFIIFQTANNLIDRWIQKNDPGIKWYSPFAERQFTKIISEILWLNYSRRFSALSNCSTEKIIESINNAFCKLGECGETRASCGKQLKELLKVQSALIWHCDFSDEDRKAHMICMNKIGEYIEGLISSEKHDDSYVTKERIEDNNDIFEGEWHELAEIIKCRNLLVELPDAFNDLRLELAKAISNASITKSDSDDLRKPQAILDEISNILFPDDEKNIGTVYITPDVSIEILEKRISDCWKQIEKNIDELKKSLKKYISVFPGQFDTIIGRFKNNVGAVLEDICISSFVYDEGVRVLQYMQDLQNNRTENVWNTDDVITAILRALRKKSNAIINSSFHYRLLNDTSVSLGYYEKNPKIYKERFIEQFVGDKKQFRYLVKSTIDNTLTMYQEVFADLCMCAAMGFEPFGYLHFSVFHHVESNHGRFNYDGRDLTYQRYAFVLNTIGLALKKYTKNTAPENTDEKPAWQIAELDKEITSFTDDVLEKLEKRFLGSFKKEGLTEAINKFKEDIGDEIQVSRAAQKAWAGLMDKSIRGEEINNTDNTIYNYNNLYEYLKKIEEMARAKFALQHIFESDKFDTIYEHFADVFNKHIFYSPEPGCKWEVGSDIEDLNIRKRICAYYNTSEFQGFNLIMMEEMVRDCLHFCYIHYDESRKIYKRNIPIKEKNGAIEEGDVQEWLNMVVGGE